MLPFRCKTAMRSSNVWQSRGRLSFIFHDVISYKVTSCQQLAYINKLINKNNKWKRCFLDIKIFFVDDNHFFYMQNERKKKSKTDPYRWWVYSDIGFHDIICYLDTIVDLNLILENSTVSRGRTKPLATLKFI